MNTKDEKHSLNEIAIFLKSFFSASGRIGRGEFLLRYCIIFGSVGVLMWLLSGGGGDIPDFLSFILIVPAVILMYIQAVKRLHDTGHSGFWLLTIIVPFVNIYLLYLIWLAKGAEGANAYGEDLRGHEHLVNEPRASQPPQAHSTENNKAAISLLNSDARIGRAELFSQNLLAPVDTLRSLFGDAEVVERDGIIKHEWRFEIREQSEQKFGILTESNQQGLDNKLQTWSIYSTDQSSGSLLRDWLSQKVTA